MTDNLKELPPVPQNSFAWYGPEMARYKDRWLITLSRAEIKELEQVAERVIQSGQKLESITAQDFPLPTLKTRLLELRDNLMYRHGFVLIRGLQTERYTEQEASTIFYGIGTHLGSARVQNAQGHLLGHVRDLGMTSSDPIVRVYQTKERQTFHTDSCDVVGLLCLKTAKHGGLSQLVSSTTIFNEMLKQRPDLLRILFEPIPTDRRGEVPEGMLPYFLIPVFNYYEGYLTAIYQRQYIESAQRFEDAPRLTAMHIEALDLFDALANSPRLNLSMELEEGDMQFVYNHTLLHDRTGFEDWPEEARKRHLLRLWLSIPGDRPLPPVFATRFVDRVVT